jgi:hypothetical protein
MMNRSA